MDSEDRPAAERHPKMLNRVREIEQTRKRLMRELQDSIEATCHVLREIEDRGRNQSELN